MKKITFVLYSILLFSLCFDPLSAQVQNHWNQKIAQAAQEIISKKCDSCHGLQLEHPKGKFFLDMQKIAINSKYMIPGKPQDSLFFQVIDQGEMPPEESKTGPLLESEKQTLFLWVLLGAPAFEKTNSTESPMGNVKQESNEIKNSRMKSSQSAKFLGQLHPLLVHFPLALLLAAVFAEFLLMIRKKPAYSAVTLFCLILGTLGAEVSAITGLSRTQFVHFRGDLSHLLAIHRGLGIFIAVFSALITLCYVFNLTKQNRVVIWVVRVFLLILTVIVLLTGHVGGSLVYELPQIPGLSGLFQKVLG